MADDINRIPLVRDVKSLYINDHGHEDQRRKKKSSHDKDEFKRDLHQKEAQLLHKEDTHNLPHQQADNPLLDYVLKKSKHDSQL